MPSSAPLPPAAFPRNTSQDPAGDSFWNGLDERPGAIAGLVVAFTLLRLLLAATAPLLPQEAYYWTWSLRLDWSYFDHPPLATYAIAATTAVLGQTAFAIKAAAVLWSIGWNVLWARLILDMYGDRHLAFWSLAALNLTLMFEVFAIGATPDGPLVFAWTGAIWAVWRATRSGAAGWWLAAGIFTGLSWLSKYSGVLLLPVVLFFLLASPQQRHWLRDPKPYLVAIVAVVVFLPVLIWNAEHDWVSLAFQSTRRLGEMGGFKPRYVGLLLATQLLMLTPYPFVIAIGALVRGVRHWFDEATDDRARLLLLSAIVPIALCLVLSLRSIVKLNWLAPAWWSLIILGVRHVLAGTGGRRRLGRGLASSAALLLALGVAVSIPNLPVPGDLNSWSGWPQAAAGVERALIAERAHGKEVFVFSPNYKISSLIRFYLPGHPRTYAQDIYGDRALQFDMVPLDSDLRGATGLLVVSDQDQSQLDLKRLQPLFERIERVDVATVEAFGRVTRRVEIYRCTNYRGHPRRPAAPVAS
ncbi:MAG: glycosyltransferase family 39 protein [Caldimonas sp.]